MTPNEARERIEKQRAFDVTWRSVTFHLTLPPERVVRTIIRDNKDQNDAIERAMLRAALVGWDGMTGAVMFEEGEEPIPFDIELAITWLDENMEPSDMIIADLLARWNRRTTLREESAKNWQRA